MADSNPDTSTPPPFTSSALDFATLARALKEDGFFVLPRVVSQGELHRVEQRLSDEFKNWSEGSQAFQGGGLLSGHLNCYPGELARGTMNELRSSGTLAMLQRLFPTAPERARWGCNFNLPGSVEQHYHMDGVYLDHYLIVNVAVVDTDLHNGAIAMVPKTHKRFYKYWEFAAGRVYRHTKRISMQRGDVLVRLSTVWHRGMPNLSTTPRPMLALTLGESYVNNPDPFAANGGAIEFQANWFKTNVLGQIRERITVSAPITYSSYRFARSLLGNKGYETF
jgi:Phytanoyl-CoA dioxygenase (PhyH)